MKIQSKMTMYIAGSLLIILSFLIGFIAYEVNTESEKNVEEIMESMSKAEANMIKSELETALDNARTIAGIFEGYEDILVHRRRIIMGNMLKQTLMKNDFFVAVWTCWEPNALDGNDMEFVNKEGHDKTGRFVPYLYRTGKEIKLESLLDYDKEGDGDYYLIPKKTGKETVTEPYLYKVGGKELLMISLVVPIKNKENNVLGAVGVDIELNSFQEKYKEKKFYRTGFMRLISNKGIVITHPDGTRINKIAGEFANGTGRDIFEKIAKGESVTESLYSVSEKRNLIKSFAPITLGNTDTPWMFSLVVKEEEAHEKVDNLIKVILILGVVFIILIGIIVWFISGLIVKSINRMADVSFDLAEGEGDLTIRMAETGKDEIETMSRNFNNFLDKLLEIIIRIRDYANTTASGSEELSVTMTQINTSIENLINLSNSTAASIEQMSSTTSNVAENVDNLLVNSQETMELANRGGEAVKQTMGEMNKIKSVVGHGTENVKVLGRKANEIGEIVTVINEIASQTNLLALNAAIEAARAGEAGKGFEVVAEEVRKLAEKTTESTKEISKMIKEIQTETNNAIIKMEEIDNEVDEGVKVANDTGAVLENIVEKTFTLKDMINIIANSTKEQSIAAEEIAKQTEKVTSNVDETGRAIEQSTESINEIAKIAERLNQLVGTFKIEKRLFDEQNNKGSKGMRKI